MHNQSQHTLFKVQRKQRLCIEENQKRVSMVKVQQLLLSSSEHTYVFDNLHFQHHQNHTFDEQNEGENIIKILSKQLINK